MTTDPVLLAALRNIVGTPIDGGCPDCDSIATLREVTPGVFHADLGHDPTCPTWHQIRRERHRRPTT